MLSFEERQMFDKLVSDAEKRMLHVMRQRVLFVLMGLLWFVIAYFPVAFFHDKIQAMVDVALAIPAEPHNQVVSFHDLKRYTELQASLSVNKIMETLYMVMAAFASIVLIVRGVVWPSKVRRELAQLHAIQTVLAHCDEAVDK